MSFEPIRPAGLAPVPKVRQIAILIDDGNFSQVDMYAQITLRELPDDPHANLAAAWVAKHFDLAEHFSQYFTKAHQGERNLIDLAKDLHLDLSLLQAYKEQLNTKNTPTEGAGKYHLIKAWGFGFGSEMASLMGQAYLAEILDREPVVHWGENFLYREPGNHCVFSDFFIPFNNLAAQNLVSDKAADFFPPKWNSNNLLIENVQKKSGTFAKMSALYYFHKNQHITVADYYAGVISIKPWVSNTHALSKFSFDETYRYLAKKYLTPQPHIQQLADEFVKTNIAGPFVAVHARGSDKDEGYRAMTSIPMKTLNYARKRLSQLPPETKLFLMTDDEKLLALYRQTFGNCLVTTDSQRSSSSTGVHYDPNSNKRIAGQEMLVDMLIAAQADCFIGLGLSNPSQLICYFGEFTDDNYVLFGENRLKQFNTHLYKTIPVR